MRKKSRPRSSSTKQLNPRSAGVADIEMGRRIRLRRRETGISQTELAGHLGLSFQQMQKYEKGTNRIGASRIQQIADILQVPVSFLFEGAPAIALIAEGFGIAPSPAYVADFLATSEGLALVRAFSRIPDIKLRRAIVEMVELIGVNTAIAAE